MDFSFNEEQVSIQDSMQRVFADYCSDEAIKKNQQNGQPWHSELWQELAGVGVCGLPFNDDDLGLVEMCLIAELQGRYVAPLPLIPSLIEAGMSIVKSGNAKLINDVLPACGAGDSVLSVASPYSGLLDHAPLCAEQSDAGWVLNGRSGYVAYAEFAQGFVIDCISSASETVMLYCAADTEGVKVFPQHGINDEPAGYLEFNNVQLKASALLAAGDEATQLFAAQQQRAWVASAALLVGTLDEGLKRTATYVSERKQFGRALGSFQAVSQQAADAYMELESLRSVYWRALEDANEPNNFAVSAAVAKYWAAEASHRAAHTVLHLHGGIGQDLDYPIHRYFLFAKQFERYLGGADEVALMLGQQLLDTDTAQLEQLCL